MGIQVKSDGTFNPTIVRETPLRWGDYTGAATNNILVFRPRNGKGSLIDLSKGNVQFSDKGQPVYTDNGVTGDNNNGIYTTLVEPASFTMLVTCRMVASTDFTTAGDIVGAGTYSNEAGSDNDRGIFVGISSTVPDGSNNVTIDGRVRYFDSTRAPRALVIPLGIVIPKTQRSTPWVMLAITVDAANERIIYQNVGNPASLQTRQETAGSGLISLRPRVSTGGVANLFQMVSTMLNGTAPAGVKMEAAEVIVAGIMTQSQITEQYALTKAGLAKWGQTVI